MNFGISSDLALAAASPFASVSQSGSAPLVARAVAASSLHVVAAAPLLVPSSVLSLPQCSDP